MNIKVKVKFNIDDEYELSATIAEVYPQKKYRGRPLFNFDKGFVVVDTTVNRLYDGNLMRLEKQAINRYIDFLKIEVQNKWKQADNERRESACALYSWLDAGVSEEQLITLVYQNNSTRYDIYRTLFDIWLYS